MSTFDAIHYGMYHFYYWPSALLFQDIKKKRIMTVMQQHTYYQKCIHCTYFYFGGWVSCSFSARVTVVPLTFCVQRKDDLHFDIVFLICLSFHRQAVQHKYVSMQLPIVIEVDVLLPLHFHILHIRAFLYEGSHMKFLRTSGDHNQCNGTTDMTC